MNSKKIQIFLKSIDFENDSIMKVSNTLQDILNDKIDQILLKGIERDIGNKIVDFLNENNKDERKLLGYFINTTDIIKDINGFETNATQFTILREDSKIEKAFKSRFQLIEVKYTFAEVILILNKIYGELHTNQLKIAENGYKNKKSLREIIQLIENDIQKNIKEIQETFPIKDKDENNESANLIGQYQDKIKETQQDEGIPLKYFILKDNEIITCFKCKVEMKHLLNWVRKHIKNENETLHYDLCPLHSHLTIKKNNK